MQLKSKRDTISDLVVEALSNFASPRARSRLFQGLTYDSGPAVLGALAAAGGCANLREIADSALLAWLDRFPRALSYTNLFGGLAGLFVGTQLASSFCPRLTSLASQLRDTLANGATDGKRTDRVDWRDYDLIFGPSGTILALITDPDCRPELVLPAARHLALLCDQENLERLRVHSYLEDEHRSWNYGRINTGLAHGVGGVISALRAACETDSSVYEELQAPLRRACKWLVGESYIDDRGIQTWSTAGLEGAPRPSGASRRQAWCYGTPGLAWTLWEAGRVLDDITLRGFAEEAMRSFCVVFDEQIYIDDGPPNEALSICHGVAGTLAIADAFALHTGHAEARKLAEQLESYLLVRTDEIRQLAYENMTLLSGASGVLSMLLVRYGGERNWLYQLGLR